MEKIAIIYVNLPGMTKRLQALSSPEGMEVQLYPVVPRGNLAMAFQRAMKHAQARYKVYISEDIAILRQDLLSDILAAFQSHPEIGLLGLSGTNRILTSGFTYLSPQRVGFVRTADGTLLPGESVSELCPVQALDGYFLATQQNLDWRRDVVHGSLFLGVSASCEYRRAGCGVAVLAQEMPVCQLLGASFSAENREQASVLREYALDLYPLVSIVIPTYQRPSLFQQALASAAGQTYHNLDIFVTDNSHNDETKQVYERQFASDQRIHYEHHPDFDAAGNWQCAIAYDNPKADYVNWLMDDDLFHPEKIATMMDYFFQNPDVTLVTSYRELIDEDGNVLPDASWSGPVFEKTSHVAGDEMGRAMLVHTWNLVGEPTTALVKKSAMQNHRLGWTGKEGKYLISDFPTWLCALSHGNIIYLREPLSSFRQHPGQQVKSDLMYVTGMICWGMMLREALVRGVFLRKDEDKRQAVVHWLALASEALQRFTKQPELWNKPQFCDFLTVYAALAAALANGYKIAFDIDTGA